jgi:hypothetical protein
LQFLLVLPVRSYRSGIDEDDQNDDNDGDTGGVVSSMMGLDDANDTDADNNDFHFLSRILHQQRYSPYHYAGLLWHFFDFVAV